MAPPEDAPAHHYDYVGEASDESLTCNICHNVVDDHAACPSCKNGFCRGCVKRWLKTQGDNGQRATCPCCRRPLRNSKLVTDAGVVARAGARGVGGWVGGGVICSLDVLSR
jgi:hypothetical protein